ncbi:PEP-CTERM sorting domain-containing protein [Elioraea thermophila]|uniref:PEP-CTERM sorting domain-containing protein n=1 Tax=Elioraea thermophila TaxID=2185104 RepID=UPI000DF3DFB5|nr:PEP-CTERM sorting domain-containing protein [Elioraea thermophila]
MRVPVRLIAAILGLGAGLATGPATASLSQLNAKWFVLPFGSSVQPGQTQHVDVQVSITGTVTGLVNATLGPNGLPVRSSASASAPATSAANILDVDSNGQILWWTAGTRTATRGSTTFTYTVQTDTFWPSIVTLPFSQPSNLFPGGASSNADGFLAGHLFGEFDLPSPGSITLTLGADDDAWVFINGELKVDLGGVKGLTPAPITVAGLPAGTNRIDVFFADRHLVQSGLVFGADVTFRPIEVAEPASLALLGAGLLGLGFAARRRRDA